MSSAQRRQPVRPYGGISATERVAARRERFLEAGLELFGTKGYAATGVKDVCKQAGLTDRYFYESFSSTSALFITVFDQVIETLFTSVAERVAAAQPRRTTQLGAGISTFLHALGEDRRKLRVIFAEPAVAGSEAEAHMRESLRRFSGLVAETARSTRTTRMPEELIQLFALSVVGMLERVIVDWQDGHLELPIERIIEHCTSLARAQLAAIDTGEYAAD